MKEEKKNLVLDKAILKRVGRKFEFDILYLRRLLLEVFGRVREIEC